MIINTCHPLYPVVSSACKISYALLCLPVLLFLVLIYLTYRLFSVSVGQRSLQEEKKTCAHRLAMLISEERRRALLSVDLLFVHFVSVFVTASCSGTSVSHHQAIVTAWSCQRHITVGVEAGRWRGREGEEETRGGGLERQKQKENSKPPSKTCRKNEEAELLPIVQYSPSLHNNVE